MLIVVFLEDPGWRRVYYKTNTPDPGLFYLCPYRVFFSKKNLTYFKQQSRIF